MKIVRLILRLYSSGYHILLGLFLTALGVFGLVTRTSSMKLGMLPWFQGPWLHAWLLVIGLIGVASAVLALMGRYHLLLLAWSVLVFLGMAYGFFISKSYSFSSTLDARNALWLTLAALGATAAAYLSLEKPRRA